PADVVADLEVRTHCASSSRVPVNDLRVGLAGGHPRYGQGMPLAPLPDEDIEFVLADRRWCTPVVAELTLEVSEQRTDFDVGQYMLLQDPDRAVSIQSYSVANAPREDGTLTFLVTAVPDGPTSTWLT